MNKNTNKWAVEVGNANMSEAMQRLAFSYGYGWLISKNTIQYTDKRFLVFNPDNKGIFYSSLRIDVTEVVCEIINSFDKAVELFKNPPTVNLKVGGDITVDKTGNVTTRGVVIGSELFDDLVKERNKYLGRVEPVKKQKLPKVVFTYTSQSSGTKIREILVTNSNDDTIEGLDVDDGYRYKKFLRGKVTGTVGFAGFAEEP